MTEHEKELSPTLRKVARRLGLTVQRLGPASLLVQRIGKDRLVAWRIGEPDLRTHVVAHRRTVRGDPNRYQNFMARHLAQEHLRWVLRSLEINCVLDVGANTGQFATGLRASGYRGRIVSYEPVHRAYEALAEAAAADPDWHVHRLALGEVDELAEINVLPNTMSSLLKPSAFGRDWKDELQHQEVEQVSVRRLEHELDTAVAGLDQPRVFLKLDTQGFDLAAFRGLGVRQQEILGLQSEVSCLPIYDGMPTMAESLAVYEGAGFAISAMFPVSRHKRSLRAIELDAVLVRADPAADSSAV